MDGLETVLGTLGRGLAQAFFRAELSTGRGHGERHGRRSSILTFTRDSGTTLLIEQLLSSALTLSIRNTFFGETLNVDFGTGRRFLRWLRRMFGNTRTVDLRTTVGIHKLTAHFAREVITLGQTLVTCLLGGVRAWLLGFTALRNVVNGGTFCTLEQLGLLHITEHGVAFA